MSVAFDAVGPTSAGQTGTTTPQTWTHTCGSTASILLVTVAMGKRSGSDSAVTTTATYNSVSMTSLAKVHPGGGTGGYVEVFYLLNPATGAHTVSVARAGSSGTMDLSVGSVSYSGCNSVGTAVTNTGASVSSLGTGSVTSATGNMVFIAAAAGNTFSSFSQTQRVEKNANSNSGAGNVVMGDAAGASTVSGTVGLASADDIATVAVNLIAGTGTNGSVTAVAATATAAAKVPVITPSNATVTAVAATATAKMSTRPPVISPHQFIGGLSSNGRYLVDTGGKPFFLRGDTVWSFPVDAGRSGGATTYQTDFDNYFSTRGGQGYNMVMISALGSVDNGGPANTGATWDGVLPFVSSDPSTLNSTYWQRVDYMIDSAYAQGITVFLDVCYSSDLNAGALNGKTTTQATNYGTALGNRYKDRVNLVWVIGGDWFDDPTQNDFAQHIMDAIAATGDTHMMTVENNAETTSRHTSSNVVYNFGTANADFSWVYTYNETYDMVEEAWAETPTIPTIWGDGTYGSAGSNEKVMRQQVGWALTSGSMGSNYGDEGIWDWQGSASLTALSNASSGTQIPGILATFKSFGRWYDLVPDISSSFITAGRGTKAGQTTSGGGGTQYTAGSNNYVTGGLTADGKLAVIFNPVASNSITVDTTQMVSGYTARWVDPVSGSSTSTSTGTTFSKSGNNSAGGPEWFLVLEAPVAGSATVNAVAATATAAAVAPTMHAGATITEPHATASAAAVVPSLQHGSTVTEPHATASAAAVAPTLHAGATVTAPHASASAAAAAPAVGSVVHVTPPHATATAGAVVPTMHAGATITEPHATASAAAVAPSLQHGSTVTEPHATATAGAVVPTVHAGATITEPHATASAAAVAPTLQHGSTIAPPHATASAQARVPSLSAGGSVTISVPAATATASAVGPTLVRDFRVTSVAATAFAHSKAPVVTEGSTVRPTAATASAQAKAPTVGSSGSGSVSGVAATASAHANAPVVTAVKNCTISAVHSTASAHANAPIVSAGGNVTVNAVRATATASAHSVTFVLDYRAPAVRATATAAMGYPVVRFIPPGLPQIQIYTGGAFRNAEILGVSDGTQVNPVEILTG